MNDLNPTDSAPLSLIVCFASIIFSAILNNVDIVIRIMSAGMAMVSAFFAARYYVIAARAKKEEMKNLKK